MSWSPQTCCYSCQQRCVLIHTVLGCLEGLFLLGYQVPYWGGMNWYYKWTRKEIIKTYLSKLNFHWKFATSIKMIKSNWKPGIEHVPPCHIIPAKVIIAVIATRVVEEVLSTALAVTRQVYQVLKVDQCNDGLKPCWPK